MRTILSLLALLCAPLCALPTPSSLSVEQKVGQLLMVHFQGLEANDEARRILAEAHVGGFIYYNWANDLSSSSKTQELSNGLQRLSLTHNANVPLLLAVDQEGGYFARIKNEGTHFPSNMAIAATQEPAFACSSALQVGEQLRDLGINMNLAPVVDVNGDQYNSVIHTRSFGTDPLTVTTYAKQALIGYQQSGIIATLKHFPGHGTVSADARYTLPVSAKNLEELNTSDLLPFIELHRDAPAIMTAHIFVPAIDAENCATLSPTLLQGVLREKIGYKGVIISDSLVMASSLATGSSIEEVSLRAVQAGCDILLLGGAQLNREGVCVALTTDDVIRVHHYLVESVKNGKLSTERLDASVERILAMKADIPVQPIDTTPVSVQSLANEVAERVCSITHQATSLPVNLADKKLLIIAPQTLQATIEQAMQLTTLAPHQILWMSSLSEAWIAEASEAARSADVVLFLSSNLWQSDEQLNIARTLANENPTFFLCCIGYPAEAPILEETSVVTMTTLSPDPASLQVAFQRLFD